MEEKTYVVSSGDKVLDILHKEELAALIGTHHFEALTVTPFEEYTAEYVDFVKELVEEDFIPF